MRTRILTWIRGRRHGPLSFEGGNALHCHKSGGAPEKIRTSDLQLRRLPLYPAELRARSSSLALIVTG